jgi:hypothetical protein
VRTSSTKIKYPELVVFPDRPTWLNDGLLAKFRSDPMWLDSSPSGILATVVAYRDR